MKGLSLLALLLVPLTARADEGIVTDRPDVAEASETVGQFRFQVETGVDLETTRAGGRRATAASTPTKIRFGLLERWEVHLESGWLAHDRTSGDGPAASDTGLDDLDLGTKVHFLAGDGPLIPSLGALLALTLPVGSDGHSGEAFVLSPTLAADFALSEAWGIGSNLGLSIALSARDRAADTLRFALALGRTWAPLTDRLRTYVEIFGETVLDGGDTALSVDGGLTFLVLPVLQLDLAVRIGLTDDAADVGGGLGVSFKI